MRKNITLKYQGFQLHKVQDQGRFYQGLNMMKNPYYKIIQYKVKKK
jgi:hypothetical protein